MQALTTMARARCVLAASLAGLFLPTPASAQMDALNRNMTLVQTAMLGASVLIFSCLIIYVGVQIGWRHAKLTELWNVVIGASLVGSAVGLAGLLVK